ncbi:MAG: hypothetical protein ACE5G3_11150 [Gammaproteobacteria bacterium]
MRRIHYIHLGGRNPPNPLVQIMGFLAAVAAFVLAVVIGGLVLAALVGFVLLSVVAFYARLWWLRRKLDGSARGGVTGDPDDVVDAEYRVIDITERND